MTRALPLVLPLLSGILLMWAQSAQSAPLVGRNLLNIGVGPLLYDYSGLSGAPKPVGARSFHVYPMISATAWVPTAWSAFYFVPSFVFTPIPRKEEDTFYEVSLFALSVPFARTFGPIDVKFGPGLMIQRVVATQGGVLTLNNGDSTFDFALASKSGTAKLLYLDLGVGASFWRIRLDLDSFWTGGFSSRRSVSFLLRASVAFL